MLQLFTKQRLKYHLIKDWPFFLIIEYSNPNLNSTLKNCQVWKFWVFLPKIWVQNCSGFWIFQSLVFHLVRVFNNFLGGSGLKKVLFRFGTLYCSWKHWASQISMAPSAINTIVRYALYTIPRRSSENLLIIITLVLSLYPCWYDGTFIPRLWTHLKEKSEKLMILNFCGIVTQN